MLVDYAIIKPSRELIEGNNVTLEFVEAEGSSELSILQEAVGGLIEPLTHFFPWAKKAGLEVYGNEEAAIYNLPASCLVVREKYWPEHPRHFVAWLRGNLVFVRHKLNGDMSLTEQDKELIKDEFWWGIDFNATNPDDPDGDFLRPFIQTI